jgi:hypothetical protein
MFRLEKVVLPADFHPLPKTVVSGHKRIWRECPGNLYLKEAAHKFIPTYLAAKNKDEKSHVVTGILRIIHDECPMGAFVQVKDGHFYEVEDLFARDKIAGVLHDLLPNHYRTAIRSRCEHRAWKKAAAKKTHSKSLNSKASMMIAKK